MQLLAVLVHTIQDSFLVAVMRTVRVAFLTEDSVFWLP